MVYDILVKMSHIRGHGHGLLPVLYAVCHRIRGIVVNLKGLHGQITYREIQIRAYRSQKAPVKFAQAACGRNLIQGFLGPVNGYLVLA